MCPCKKSANDFKSYEISEEASVNINNEEAASKVLLFDQALEAQSGENFGDCLKIHCLILGKKLHPDENASKLKEKCEVFLKKINQAYFTILGSPNSYFS